MTWLKANWPIHLYKKSGLLKNVFIEMYLLISQIIQNIEKIEQTKNKKRYQISKKSFFKFYEK